ncbi:MAG TPA: peptidylprolyl isomerase [Ignavibacteriaceae bacterium]|nr:peptidylprolyl isomerase [Ignavibacteriaceae bacterium]
MRSLAPAFILTVGGLFVLFMVISDSNVLEALGGGRTNNIGSVNGEDITYQEFQTAVDQQVENQKKQTGQDPDETQLDQIRDQVWDAIVTQKVFAQLIKKYGITITDQEIKDAILGENPPDFLKQNFIDSLGNFNRQLYEQAIFDPQNKAALIQAEEYIRQSKLTQKLQSMVLASVNVGEDEVERRFIDQNTNIEADYILFDVNKVKDADVNVTDEDLKAYYDKNLNMYKVPPQRKLKFVLFKNVASSEDSQMVYKNLLNVKNLIITGDTASFSQLVGIYSETPDSKDTLAVNMFTPEIISAFKKSAVGDVVGPFATPQGYVLYRYLGSVPTTDISVKASHILINQYGSDENNLAEANKIYQRLIAGESFEKLAKEFSQDPGSGSKGGDLGYFGKGMMVKEFEDASFAGAVGVVQKPIKTNYGYHIIKVTDRADRKYIVERIVNTVKQSASSRDRNFNAANDFSYLANKNDFDAEAKLMNYTVQETPFFTEQAVSIPTLGNNKRLVKFSFENSVNTVSDVYKVANGYVVAKISEVENEKFRPLDELKEQIKPAVIREKKFEVLKKTVDDVYSKIGGDMTKAAAIDSNYKVQQTGNFTPQGSIPLIGRDYAFINTALKLKLDTVSEPIKGARGYYLIKVTKRSDFNKELFDSQSTAIRNSLMQEKRGRFLNQWVNEIKENAKVVDNRHLFFRQ